MNTAFNIRVHLTELNYVCDSMCLLICVQLLTLNVQHDGGLVDPLVICALDRVNSGVFLRHILDLQ